MWLGISIVTAIIIIFIFLIKNKNGEQDSRTKSSKACEWSTWSPCDATCGQEGKQTRRSCNKEETLPCESNVECRNRWSNQNVECQMSNWSSWSTCDADCGAGQRQRTRVILDTNGDQCDQSLLETELCSGTRCPSDCTVSDWSEWTACSANCGTGDRRRTRLIIDKADNGGKCDQSVFETESCSGAFCPVDCKVSDWSNWSDCDALCGPGQSDRHRTIVEQAKWDGTCNDSLLEHTTCISKVCPTYAKIYNNRRIAPDDWKYMFNVKLNKTGEELYNNKDEWENRTNPLDEIVITSDSVTMQNVCNSLTNCTHYQHEVTPRNYQTFYRYPPGTDPTVFRPSDVTYLYTSLWEKR
jgi:hypothetical protein